MMNLLYYIGLSCPILLSIVTFLKTDKRWDKTTNALFLITSVLTTIGIALGFYGIMTTLLLLPIAIPYIGVPNTQEIMGVGIFATWTALYPLAKILSVKIAEMRMQNPVENALYTIVYFYGLLVILSAVGLFLFVRQPVQF